MKTCLPTVAEIRQALTAFRRQDLMRLAEISGVPYTTLQKIRISDTGVPGYETVRRFWPHIVPLQMEIELAAEQARASKDRLASFTRLEMLRLAEVSGVPVATLDRVRKDGRPSTEAVRKFWPHLAAIERSRTRAAAAKSRKRPAADPETQPTAPADGDSSCAA